MTLSTQDNKKLLEQLKSGLSVPKVTFYRLVRNIYGVELNVRLIWQIFGPRNIDILPLFFLQSRGDPSGKRKGSERAEQAASS